MDALSIAFEERLQEIESYLDLLESLELEVRGGPPRIGGGGVAITPQQQKILYSSVYLQLYNLIEASITKCLDAVTAAIADGGHWQAGDLSAQLRKEWVRYKARTHTDMSADKRLLHALQLCDFVVGEQPVASFEVEKGGGGNWHDEHIEKISERLGLPLRINSTVRSNIKRNYRNEKGALQYIVDLRNNLAHGSLSFAECGEGMTVGELRDLKERTSLYLKEVVDSFGVFIDTYGYLCPASRPAIEAT